MSGSRWFATVLMAASCASEPIMLEELERVLDAAQPTKIGPEQNEAYDGSFVIAHTENPLGNIDIEVWADWADLKSISIDRQIRAAEFGPAWIHETGRAVDRIIRGTYEIERARWRNHITVTTVTTEGHTRPARTAWGWLPLPARLLTYERFHLDYGTGIRTRVPSH